MKIDMNKLKINFRLKELDKIVLWGQAPHLYLDWFGLTDGLLWINVGTQTIYEYTDEANNYFGHHSKYNDYQISRFLEDFFNTFKYVGESIPEWFYNSLGVFDTKLEKWRDLYLNEDEEIYKRFLFDEYSVLGQWKWDRTFDSGYLVGGPVIGCFKCGKKIKILWKSSHKLDNGKSIWTSPEGSLELSYDDFILSVSEFLNSFFIAMDSQIEKAVIKEWGSVLLDKQRLLKENNERKIRFSKDLSFLTGSIVNTDWNKIGILYSKMQNEIKLLK